MASNYTAKKQQVGILVINLDEPRSFAQLKDQMVDKISVVDDLLGSQVVLNTGHRRLTRREISELDILLLKNGLHLKKIISRGRSIDLGEEEEVPARDNTVAFSAVQNRLVSGNTALIRQTLRSGQKVFDQGNVVILGDVNPGAEVVAGGNILVMGTLRGMAHAGAMGEETAVVAAFRLAPTQLRIANHITRAPEDDREGGKYPEVASIKDGRVVIEKFRV